jgi:hypothetical protein
MNVHVLLVVVRRNRSQSVEEMGRHTYIKLFLWNIKPAQLLSLNNNYLTPLSVAFLIPQASHF